MTFGAYKPFRKFRFHSSRQAWRTTLNNLLLKGALDNPIPTIENLRTGLRLNKRKMKLHEKIRNRRLMWHSFTSEVFVAYFLCSLLCVVLLTYYFAAECALNKKYGEWPRGRRCKIKKIRTFIIKIVILLHLHFFFSRYELIFPPKKSIAYD